MAVPKQKRSKGRQRKARMNIFLKTPTLTKCQKCGRLILPHTVCPFCGNYRGRQVIDVFAKLTKKERKEREKEIKIKEREEKKELKKTTAHPLPSRERGPKPLGWKELSRQ